MPRGADEVKRRPVSTGTHPEPPVAFTGKTAARGVRWNLYAVAVRQGFQVVAALLLARILGPVSYGIVSVANIYVIFVTLLLDQGLSAALVQRPSLSSKAPGATVTLNLLSAVALGFLTWVTAPPLAEFFHVPELVDLLRILAVALPLKAVAITPRALLSRSLRFGSIALSDIGGAATGAVVGVAAAILGADYFAIAYQVVTTDLVTACVLLIGARGPRPNLRLSHVRPLLAFSAGIFAVNGLAYFSRNIDNIVVGRVLGASSLSLYAMAYRVLATPVMLFGQTVNRVMFPVFSRHADDRPLVSANLLKAMAMLALLVVPTMTYVACAAGPLVRLVLGEEWLAAASLVSVLAIGGARETIFFIAPSLMRGMGRAGLNLRYEILATVAQVSGILVGIQFGLLGVAVGYTAAGFVLTPVLLVLQSRLSGARVGTQLATIWPAVHSSAWGAAAYLLLSTLQLDDVLEAGLGLVVFGLSVILVLLIFHRERVRQFVVRLRTLADVRK